MSPISKVDSLLESINDVYKDSRVTEEQVPLSYNKVSADDLIAVSKTMPDTMCKEIE
jgi:hypothetical protein